MGRHGSFDHEPRFGGTRGGGPSCGARGRSPTFGTAIAHGLEECEREPIMSETLPVVYLARHGETAWTISRQHTGLTDLPLTAQGEAEAARLGQRLEGLTFAAVLTSPLKRAVRTCELAGFGSTADIEPNLVEWNYGAYEGRTSAEIQSERPDWQLFRDGCPEGESPEQIGARADGVISRRSSSACRPGRAGTSCSARPASARWGASTIALIR
jgi:Histidine phosphatase superfamily (branch 1)